MFSIQAHVCKRFTYLCVRSNKKKLHLLTQVFCAISQLFFAVLPDLIFCPTPLCHSSLTSFTSFRYWIVPTSLLASLSWNWLHRHDIMFCTSVLDWLTGRIAKQLLDKLVLNRFDLPACRFEHKYQNLKILAGCPSIMFGEHFLFIGSKYTYLGSDP